MSIYKSFIFPRLTLFARLHYLRAWIKLEFLFKVAL